MACSGQGDSTDAVGLRLGQEGQAILEKAGVVGRALGQRKQCMQWHGGRTVHSSPQGGTAGAQGQLCLKIKLGNGEPFR